jgi:hypothetical protein
MAAGLRSDGPGGAARVVARDDAERLVAGVIATMRDLEKVLADETAHVRVGRLREGLAEEARKSELATAYMRGLEAVKANAIALARFAPDALEKLKAAHSGFGRAVETNQTVLATARAVSETLVKGVAEEMNRLSRPQGYAPAGTQAARPARSEPLIVSKSL